MTIRLAALVTTSVAFAIVVLSFSVREPSGPTGQIAERREASEGVAPSEALRHIAASSPASAGDPADARRVEERGAQLEEASDSEAPSPYYGYFVYADEGVKRVDVDLEPGHSIVFGEPPPPERSEEEEASAARYAEALAPDRGHSIRYGPPPWDDPPEGWEEIAASEREEGPTGEPDPGHSISFGPEPPPDLIEGEEAPDLLMDEAVDDDVVEG